MSYVAARQSAEAINILIIKTYASRRALIGVGMGERAPAGAARAAMDLVEIKETRRAVTLDGKSEVVEVTRPGFRTARRRLPAVLSRMTERDARRRAADLYAYACEKIGSVAGASAGGDTVDGGAGSNDGGVTTRIEYAGTITAVEGVLARAGAVLMPGRGPANRARRAITARELLDAICLDASDMKAILVAAGWSGQRRDVAKLRAAAEECLEDMARALGLISPDARRLAEPG